MLAAFLLLVFVVSVLAQSPTSDLLRQADQSYRSGDLAKATALLQQAVTQDPNAAPVYMLLGIINSQRGEWDQAAKHFKQVVRLDPSNAQGHYFLGTAFRAQGNWTEAAGSFSKALDNRFPEKERLRIELAAAQIQSGDARGALATLQASKEPTDKGLAAQFHGMQAFALAQLEQPHAAIEAIRRALELFPLNALYWDFYVSSLIGTGQPLLALSEAIRAQRLFPNHPDIQYCFGIAASYVPESPFTKLALRRLREAQPADPRALLLEGLAKQKVKEIPEARKLLTEAMQAGVPEAHLFLGILLAEEGNYAGAEQNLRRAEETRPRDGQVFFALGKVLLALDKLAEAEALLTKAERYMPANAGVQELLSQVYAAGSWRGGKGGAACPQSP